jgi:hemerythrin-like domain-containing protein
MHAALGIIFDEHRTLAAVLHGLKFVVHDVRTARGQPDFELFRALVYYIDAYPERLHHPKEEQFLFASLRSRTRDADQLLDDLGREHQAGDGAIRALEKKLLAFEFGGQFEAFADAADTYVDAYFSHMHKEEQQVLPLAQKWLTADDWSEVGAAFAANTDPAAGGDAPRFRALFSRIVNLAPPPIGVGPLFPRQRT